MYGGQLAEKVRGLRSKIDIQTQLISDTNTDRGNNIPLDHTLRQLQTELAKCFRKGTRVSIKDLVNAAYLNGTLGTIETKLKADGRVGVRCSVDAKKRLIKLNNLDIVDVFTTPSGHPQPTTNTKANASGHSSATSTKDTVVVPTHRLQVKAANMISDGQISAANHPRPEMATRSSSDLPVVSLRDFMSGYMYQEGRAMSTI